MFERIRKDIEKIKTMSNRKDRLIFIWDYYKFVILFIVCALLIGTIAVVEGRRHEDVAMYVVTLNSDYALNELDENVFMEGLVSQGYETEGKSVDVNAALSLGRVLDEDEDMSTRQVLTALFTIGDLDLFVSDEEYFVSYAQYDAFADLSGLLDEELLEGERLISHVNEDGEEIIDGFVLESDSPLHKAGYYHEEVVIGIVENGSNMDTALLFVKSLLD